MAICLYLISGPNFLSIFILLMYSLNFLSINRFERKKNIDLAISAFARLLTVEGSNARDVTLTIVGMSLNLKSKSSHLPSCCSVRLSELFHITVV